MTMQIFCSGELLRSPEQKTSANGNTFVSALAKCGDSIVSITAFDTAIREQIMALHKGDALAVSGRLTARAYLDKNNEPQPGLGVLANQIMTAPAKRATATPRPRNQHQPQGDQQRAYQAQVPARESVPAGEPAPVGGLEDFDDDLPF